MNPFVFAASLPYEMNSLAWSFSSQIISIVNISLLRWCTFADRQAFVSHCRLHLYLFLSNRSSSTKTRRRFVENSKHFTMPERKKCVYQVTPFPSRTGNQQEQYCQQVENICSALVFMSFLRSIWLCLDVQRAFCQNSYRHVFFLWGYVLGTIQTIPSLGNTTKPSVRPWCFLWFRTWNAWLQ